MSFFDQKPFVVDQDHLRAPWSGGKNGKYFRCGLCGYKFQKGDVARWQYTNDTKAYGNPMICQKCDGDPEEVKEKWKKMHEEAKNKFWWFTREK